MQLNKIIVCPDSFKGSLKATEVADIIRQRLLVHFPHTDVISLPLADGGEGTLEVISQNCGKWESVNCEAHNPLMKKIYTSYLIDFASKTAIIESAGIIGLDLISPDKRNPLKASSFGLGEIVNDSINKGCKKIYITLGGTATNDGGLGMLAALGFKFYDQLDNLLIPIGENLKYINKIVLPDNVKKLRETDFFVVCDVTNPLTGENGATNIYGRQKGANDEIIKFLENGMINFAEVVERTLPEAKNKKSYPGAGAAGGLGFALQTFLKSKYKSGIKFIFQMTEFEKRIEGADLLITGEGRIDCQSLMGKVLNGILEIANQRNIPLIAIGGKINDEIILKEAGIKNLFAISNPVLSLNENIRKENAVVNLKRGVDKLSQYLQESL